MNLVILTGRVGLDPEIKTTEKGKFARFSFATDASYTDKSGQKVEKKEWHSIVARNNMAELVEKYITKGKQMSITGHLETHSYTDNKEIKRNITHVVMDRVEFLDNKKPENAPQMSSEDKTTSEGDDLPF